MQLPSFITNLKPLTKMVTLSIFLMGIGWSGHVMFAQQIGLPATVQSTVARVGQLEHRMDDAEAILGDYTTTTMQLRSLSLRVDTLSTFARDTYCIVRAHALELDPFETCTLGRNMLR